jgi:hypothetical protein
MGEPLVYDPGCLTWPERIVSRSSWGDNRVIVLAVPNFPGTQYIATFVTPLELTLL